MGITLVSTIISGPDPSAVPDVVSLPSPSWLVEEETDGVVPYP